MTSIQGPSALGAASTTAAPQSPADRFIAQAMTFRGQPYRWGGGHGGDMCGPGPVDCSGLIGQAAKQAGLNLSGTAEQQQRMGQPVSMSDLKPGDLVFCGKPAHHVGIYVGNGLVLHAPHTGDQVKLSPVSYFDNAVRVFDQAGQPVAETQADKGSMVRDVGDRDGVRGGGNASGMSLADLTLRSMWRTDKDEEELEQKQAANAAPDPSAGPVHSGLTNVDSNATGNLDDIAQATVASTEAQTTMELASTVRNKAVDAFNQIMNMQA